LQDSEQDKQQLKRNVSHPHTRCFPRSSRKQLTSFKSGVLNVKSEIREPQKNVSELKRCSEENEEAYQREMWKLMNEMTEFKEQTEEDCKAHHEFIEHAKLSDQDKLAAAKKLTAQLVGETVKPRREKFSLEQDLQVNHKPLLEGLQQIVELQAELRRLREISHVVCSKLSPESVMMDIAKAKIAALEKQNEKLIRKNEDLYELAVKIPNCLVAATAELGTAINCTRRDNIKLRTEIRKLQYKRQNENMQLGMIQDDISNLESIINHRQGGMTSL
jgi:hypothetical protein